MISTLSKSSWYISSSCQRDQVISVLWPRLSNLALPNSFLHQDVHAATEQNFGKLHGEILYSGQHPEGNQRCSAENCHLTSAQSHPGQQVGNGEIAKFLNQIKERSIKHYNIRFNKRQSCSSEIINISVLEILVVGWTL